MINSISSKWHTDTPSRSPSRCIRHEPKQLFLGQGKSLLNEYDGINCLEPYLCGYSLFDEILTSKWKVDAFDLLRPIFLHRLMHKRTFSFFDPSNWPPSSLTAAVLGVEVRVKSGADGSFIVGRLSRLWLDRECNRDLVFLARSRSVTEHSTSVTLMTFLTALNSRQFGFVSRFENKYGLFSNDGSIDVVERKG